MRGQARWGTHPADEKRMAIVIATMDEIEASQILARKAGQWVTTSFDLGYHWPNWP